MDNARKMAGKMYFHGDVVSTNGVLICGRLPVIWGHRVDLEKSITLIQIEMKKVGKKLSERAANVLVRAGK